MHIVFLHGFLGTPQDFMSLAFRLPFKTDMISLPGHGCSDANVDFTTANDWLTEELAGLKVKDYILYGYSLGGRIALNYALNTKKKPQTLILESVNIGLADALQKKERLAQDLLWSKRFKEEDITKVLKDWYNQPIFNKLSDEDKELLIKKRSKNNPKRIAQVLENLSLAKMPFLGEGLKKITIPTLYLYGSEDEKFKKIATKITSYHNPQISVQEIAGASHNCHLTNSSDICNIISKFIA